MQPEEVVQISPLIRRITAGNASVFTGPGTNTYLIGKEEITVLDPGPAMDSHIDAITSAEGKIKQIVVTHTHPDHSPGVRLLQERLDVPAYGMLTETSKGQDRSFKPDKILKDGDMFEETEFTLKVVHTPGHASNHLCYILEEEEFIFTGDHIMNGSTVVIGPPDGNMKQYLDSLEKLKQFKLSKIAPGHGEVLDSPYEVAEWIINHRLQREEKVATALKEATKGNPESLVSRVYDDVDSSLFPIAKASLLAHLIKLEEDNVASKEGDDYVWKGVT
jgi:glyoxylase-like metal-dependent hydrolase (beta-lactamase superfamily II)